jgi:speckle-type POZ protein
MMNSAFAVVEFKVNYEKIKHLPAGHAVKSDPISVGGQVWKINFYPRGAYELAALSHDHFSIFLERQIKSDRPIKSIFEVLLIDKNGDPVMVSSKIPPPLQRYYGKYQWLASQNYMVHNYVKDGHIKFVSPSQCYLTILSLCHLLTLGNIWPLYWMALMRERMCHLQLTVRHSMHTELFLLHARRSFGRSCLVASCMAEATMSCIALHDIAPATFKAMLQFMYTDALPGEEELGDCPTDMFENLLVAADRYALDRLKLMCAQKLWENISVETVCDALACAEIYNCPELKEKCIEFVVEDNNFKKIVLTDSFMQLGQKFPSIITEVRERLAGI